jgi:DNA-binding NtrC family response regulator
MDRVQSPESPDVLVLDMPHGDGDGLNLLRWLRRLRPELPIILICDPRDEAGQQEAIRLGARECLVRPLEGQDVEKVIKHHLSAAGGSLEPNIVSEDVEPIGGDAIFVGASHVMRKLRAQAELLAVTNVPVLILGESGSGKKTTAHLIHKLSVRSEFGFAKVNCAALPSDLLESELFGNGQNGNELSRPKPGKLDLCDKGTILLDEITEMPMTLQAKLVQLLQHKRFVRPGTRTSCEVDVRVLAASSTNVETATSENKLREDLYYLLSRYTIHVPPLRQRREEVSLLLRHFMYRLAKRYGLSPLSFSPAVLEACQSHSWPGNLRELENFVKRYLMRGKELAVGGPQWEQEDISNGEDLISPDSVSSLGQPANQSDASVPRNNSLKSVVRSVKLEAEKNAIAAALERTGWNRKAAARLLKVSYRTLLYKIEQHQMRSPDSTFPVNSGSKGNGNTARGNGRTVGIGLRACDGQQGGTQ